MDRLERVAVQLWEAARFLDEGTVAYQRLALDLADGAAESVLYSACIERFPFTRLSRMVEGKDFTFQERGRIERLFEEKLAYLEAEEKLDATTGRVLRRLHAYRNGTHHRDEVRPTTLDSAVRLYLYLAAQLLDDLPTIAVKVTSLDEVPGLRPFLAEIEDSPRLLLEASLSLRGQVAETIRARANLESLSELQEELARHSVQRWKEVVAGLHYLASYFGPADVTSDERLGRIIELVIDLAKTGDEHATHGLTARQRRQVASLSGSDLGRMREAPTRIQAQERPLDAFAAFADFEDDLEPLETMVRTMGYEVERAETLKDEERRGK
ncbi:hypothetical protein [Kineococcus terrestris]|uniref:hypothetical protein n=1 Tax=Kineococcus terrestris TaxID=2044856 RepID=UPI0034DB521F